MPAQQVVDVDPLSCQRPAPARSIIEPIVMVIRRRLTSRPACEISGFLVPAITLGGGVRRSRARLVKLSTNALVAPGRQCLPPPCGQDHRTRRTTLCGACQAGDVTSRQASDRSPAPCTYAVPRGAVAAARGRCRRSRAGRGPCLSIRMRRNACTPSCRMAASSESQDDAGVPLMSLPLREGVDRGCQRNAERRHVGRQHECHRLLGTRSWFEHADMIAGRGASSLLPLSETLALSCSLPCRREDAADRTSRSSEPARRRRLLLGAGRCVGSQWRYWRRARLRSEQQLCLGSRPLDG
jgi:hypothetical protein